MRIQRAVRGAVNLFTTVTIIRRYRCGFIPHQFPAQGSIRHPDGCAAPGYVRPARDAAPDSRFPEGLPPSDRVPAVRPRFQGG